MSIPQYKLLTRSSEDEEWESLNLSDPRAMQGLVSGLQALGVTQIVIGREVNVYMDDVPESFASLGPITHLN